MDYEQKYKDLVKAVKELQEANPSDERIQHWVNDNVSELIDSEDEKIRKEIIEFIKVSKPWWENYSDYSSWIAWLEKQVKKDVQVILPTFTFDDILALQCCMKTVKEVQKDEELYNQLQSLHDRLHDAYWLKKQDKNNMGIDEATKKKLEDNLNEALKKETPESWNKFLEKQGKESHYNPYKEVVTSISDMVEKYASFDSNLQDFYNNVKVFCKDAVEYDKTFLENQGEQTIAKAEKKNFASSLIKYLDDNRIKGCMGLSSIECEDLENAVVNSDWQKVYNYMKKKLEKQGEQKETLCDKCRKEQPSHSCQDITELGRCALEKQDEQKPTDEVKPKFKVGDWIINNDKRIAVPIHILEISNYGYVTSSGYISFDKVKTDYHLWTIQDAKDGDVLVDSYAIIIFRKIGNYVLDDVVDFYICYSFEKGIIIQRHNLHCGSIDSVFFKPATKEQRDTLMKAIAEAGYEWDFEVKELNKIEKKPDCSEEEKQLLLKDLCARLPYKVRCKCVSGLDGGETEKGVLKYVGNCYGVISNYYEGVPLHSGFVNNVFYPIENIKPYLRPMSSMTDEEFQKLRSICPHSMINKTNVTGWFVGINGSDYGRISRVDEISEFIDWLNAHHFDFRELIEKGLALEAPEGMYNS